MILDVHTAHGVADGSIRLAFRRWAKPRVKPGETFISSAGTVAVESIRIISPEAITTDDALAAGVSSRDALLATFRGSEGDPIFRIGLRWCGHDPRTALSNEMQLPPEVLHDIVMRLERMDRRSTHGAWTYEVLRLIGENPGRRAAELAAERGLDKDAFKVDVRKLKNLGLTHSLEVGYRLSPRGRSFLDQT